MITNLLKNFIPIQVCFFILGLMVYNYSVLIIFEAILVLLYFLNKWGKGITLREVISFHAVFIILFMPLIGFKFYTVKNPVAKLFVKYMPIDEFEYFHFVFPAVLIYVLVLCWPINQKKIQDEGKPFVQKLSLSIDKLHSSRVNPIFLIIVGSFMYFMEPYLPLALRYIGNLAFNTSFVGFLMLYLNSKAKYRKLFITYFGLFILYVSVSSTMFTIIMYMGMTISSFLYFNLTLSLWKKLAFFLFICSLVVALQNIKGVFRSSTGDQNRALYLGKLLSKEISRGYGDFSANRFFPFYERTNQGFLVAKVLNYIPQKKDFDNGAYLSQAILSSFVPRAFWPEKPMAGGRFTMKYFTGEELGVGTSMNVSPVGEAYGSFGPVWGIVYMSVLAFFIRIVYSTFMALTNSIPFLIYWFPVIFFQVTYSMETDSLQIFNSLVKSATFIFILYVMSPSLFGVEKKKLKNSASI